MSEHKDIHHVESIVSNTNIKIGYPNYLFDIITNPFN
jgi:hypothetical protein